MMIENHRRSWNKKQTALRRLLADVSRFEEARQSLGSQHAQLHSADLGCKEPWSFEDEIFSGLTSDQARAIAKKEGHSIVWLIWHLARIEDVAMNILVADRSQILHQGDWQERMRIRFADTGNAMAASGITTLSAEIDIPGLRAYRLAVGRSTQELIYGLGTEELMKKVQPARLKRIREERAVVEAASDLLDYWGRRNVAGLLLMPATRHNFVHLNEAYRIKQKMQ